MTLDDAKAMKIQVIRRDANVQANGSAGKHAADRVIMRGVRGTRVGPPAFVGGGIANAIGIALVAAESR